MSDIQDKRGEETLGVYKLQRSIMTDEDTQQLLIKSADGNVPPRVHQMPLTEDVAKLFGDEWRIYVIAEIEEGGAFVIHGLASEEDVEL